MKRCKVPFCGQKLFESQEIYMDCSMGDVPGRPTWQQHAEVLEQERDAALDRIREFEKEYEDYQTVASHCSAVYDHFSGGLISKPFTHPEHVIARAEDIQTQDFEDWFKERAAEILEERDQSRLGELHAGEAVEELKAAILKALGWLDVGLVWNARVVLQKALAPVGTDIAEKKS